MKIPFWPAAPSKPYVRYFPIIAAVVESGIAALVKRSGQDRTGVCAAIKSQIEECSNEWYSNRVPNINYSNPLCRLGYLYEIVPSTASIVEHAFTDDDELNNYFNEVRQRKGAVSVCAFGEGPGSELLGLCKWIERSNIPGCVTLDYLLLDRVNEWLDSWRAIRKEIESRFAANIGVDRLKWPLAVSGSFSAVDISNLDTFGNLGALFDQDLFILSYVISEIFANFQNFRSFTEKVAQQAPTGAKFLFIDRRGDRWKDEIRTVAAEARIQLSKFNDYDGTMEWPGEDAGDLGGLRTEIGKDPKLRWKAFWVVGTKQ